MKKIISTLAIASTLAFATAANAETMFGQEVRLVMQEDFGFTIKAGDLPDYRYQSPDDTVQTFTMDYTFNRGQLWGLDTETKAGFELSVPTDHYRSIFVESKFVKDNGNLDLYGKVKFSYDMFSYESIPDESNVGFSPTIGAQYTFNENVAAYIEANTYYDVSDDFDRFYYGHVEVGVPVTYKNFTITPAYQTYFDEEAWGGDLFKLTATVNF